MLDITRTSPKHALAALAFAAAGCGTSVPARCDATETITLQLHAARHLNPDRAGLPRSVVLRLYQLREPGDFRASSFDRLWGAPTTAARPDQLIALPGRDTTQRLKRDPSAHYLAALANFRERSGEFGWRAVMRLPEPQDACEHRSGKRKSSIVLELADYALQLR